MNQPHTLEMGPSAAQSQPEAETLSVLLARAAIFIFLFGLVCLLLNVDKNTLGTILIGVALVFVILSLKKVIKGNWHRRKTRRSSTVRICMPTHQWRRIFEGELPIQNNQPQQSPFNDLMQLSEGLSQAMNPTPALLPPTYEQAVADLEQPLSATETNGIESIENNREQREAQYSNGEADVKPMSIATETNAEEIH